MLLIIKLFVSLAVDGLLLECSLFAGLLVIGFTIKTRTPIHCFIDMDESQFKS